MERYIRIEEKNLRPLPNSVRELYGNIVTSAERQEKRNLLQDMRDYLDLQGVQVKAENQGTPDPSKFLIIAPNHHARRALFTTGESLNMVALSAVGANNTEATFKHTAWIIKKLDVHRVGPGILARKVQNAAIVCYGQIPIVVERKFERTKFGLPKSKERIANLDQFGGLVFNNIMQGNNIGYFPEQTPTQQLKQYDPNFPRFIRRLQGVSEEFQFQIMPVSIFYEGKTANVRFGQIIDVVRDSEPVDIAGRTMRRIAGNLPKKLRGAYS